MSYQSSPGQQRDEYEEEEEGQQTEAPLLAPTTTGAEIEKQSDLGKELLLQGGRGDGELGGQVEAEGSDASPFPLPEGGSNDEIMVLKDNVQAKQTPNKQKK